MTGHSVTETLLKIMRIWMRWLLLLLLLLLLMLFHKLLLLQHLHAFGIHSRMPIH